MNGAILQPLLPLFGFMAFTATNSPSLLSLLFHSFPLHISYMYTYTSLFFLPYFFPIPSDFPPSHNLPLSFTVKRGISSLEHFFRSTLPLRAQIYFRLLQRSCESRHVLYRLMRRGRLTTNAICRKDSNYILSKRKHKYTTGGIMSTRCQ